MESLAGEYGGAHDAMEAATKNAKEMIDVLTIQFNKARQEKITKELLDTWRRRRPSARSGGMSTGKIVQVIGPVVDVEFEPGRLRASTTRSSSRASRTRTSFVFAEAHPRGGAAPGREPGADDRHGATDGLRRG